MNCIKCEKEIPEGENKLCEDCQKELMKDISKEEKKAQKEKNKKERAKKEPSAKMKKIKALVNKNKFFLIGALVIIILLILAASVFSTKNTGNSIGNIRNYGYATQSGNWIYFLSPDEKSEQLGIFKMKEGDNEQKSKQQLVMDKWDILSLNVSGNYVYFIGILPIENDITSDKVGDAENTQIDIGEVDNKIYRMKTDGSDLEVINDNEFDEQCYEIYVVGNHVYYIGKDYNIYKMDLDGNNKQVVIENQTGYLGLTDKYIIYNVENEDQTDYITYIADLNGKNARPIIEGTRLYSINIVGEYIYYTNEAKAICKVKTDGTNQKVLYETTAYNMNVSGNYIYYLNYEDEANSNYTVCIYRVKTNGTTAHPEIIKKLETYSSFIDVMNDWIIYMDSSEKEGFINLLKTDGKEEIKVYSLDYTKLNEESTTGNGQTQTENQNETSVEIGDDMESTEDTTTDVTTENEVQ